MQDKWGVTPLMAACFNGHITTAKILVENGAIVDLLNRVIKFYTMRSISNMGQKVHSSNFIQYHNNFYYYFF